jgi:hypothetical protein
MLNTILTSFYERDIRKMIAEVELFRDEENLWKTHGDIRNSSGNLVLHIIGGTNYLIGATLANTGYVRNRDLEFTAKNVPRRELVEGLEKLIPMITGTLNGYSQEDMDSAFPFDFDGARNSKTYVLVQLLAHLNYHLGQVNYLRRMLEG